MAGGKEVFHCHQQTIVQRVDYNVEITMLFHLKGAKYGVEITSNIITMTFYNE